MAPSRRTTDATAISPLRESSCRARLPGEFLTPPPTATQMYHPEVWERGAGQDVDGDEVRWGDWEEGDKETKVGVYDGERPPLRKSLVQRTTDSHRVALAREQDETPHPIDVGPGSFNSRKLKSEA